VDEGAITGTVLDSTGAVVANAQVTLLNTDQGITTEIKSDGNGLYTFAPVRRGHYTVTVTAQGFAKTTQKNLTLNVAQVMQVNVTLKLGAATETVEVNTAPPLLQTEEASVGQVIGAEQVNALPLNGRNFTFLAQLGAGMQTPQADTRGNAASGAFSANGLRPAQNNYLLDGIDNNSNAVDFLNGTNFIIQFRNSRFRPRTSALNWVALRVRFSTPPSSPAPTASMARRGNSSATTNSTLPIGLKRTRPTRSREHYVSINSALPLAAPSSRTSSSSSAIMKGSGACRATRQAARPCQQRPSAPAATPISPRSWLRTAVYRPTILDELPRKAQ
jgi:hypothetical protein